MTPPIWILVVFFAAVLISRDRSAYFFLGKSRDESWCKWWERIGR
jgi:hypothetical protein